MYLDNTSGGLERVLSSPIGSQEEASAPSKLRQPQLAPHSKLEQPHFAGLQSSAAAGQPPSLAGKRDDTETHREAAPVDGACLVEPAGLLHGQRTNVLPERQPAGMRESRGAELQGAAAAESEQRKLHEGAGESGLQPASMPAGRTSGFLELMGASQAQGVKGMGRAPALQTLQREDSPASDASATSVAPQLM